MPPELIDPATPTRHVSRRWLLRDVVLVIAVFAIGGALCGLVWQWAWSPPTGAVVDHEWQPGIEGARDVFSATALYVVVASVGGLVLGAAGAWLFDRSELVTLLSVVAGSALAAWLMLQTGTALAPPDPQVAAATAPDQTRLPGTLQVQGTSPFFAFPIGAAAGLAAVFIGLTPNQGSRH